MTLAPDDSRWFARRNGIVRGPFTDEHMARYVLLGRIRVNDELSLDRVRWRPAGEYPRLFPRGLLQPSGPEDYRRLMAARIELDERTRERRMTQADDPRPAREERRVLAERREASNGAGILDYARTDDHAYRPHRMNNRIFHPLRTVLLAMLLMTLVLAYFGIAGR
jgi:hypothetical protein